MRTKNNKIILITGNLGYIGFELAKYLKEKDKKLFIIGYDIGYYSKNFFQESNIKKYIDYQIHSDLRDQNFKDLEKFKIDTIFHHRKTPKARKYFDVMEMQPMYFNVRLEKIRNLSMQPRCVDR